MSRVVVELLDAAMPFLDRAARVLEAAQDVKQQIPDALRESLGKAEAELAAVAGPAVSESLGQLDLLAGELVKLRAAAGRAPKARGLPPTPVPSNHGGQVVLVGAKRRRAKGRR